MPTQYHEDPTIVNLRDEYRIVAREHHLLPVKVPKHYRALVEEERAAIGTDGPLHRAVFPTRERLTLSAPGEVADFVDDKGNMPSGTDGAIIRKYNNRILFLPTAVCIGHCQYCFRQDLLAHSPADDLRSLRSRLELLKAYLASQPEVTEVILSGGDPLALPSSEVAHILREVVSLGREVRIHTRAPIFSPTAMNDTLLEAIAESRARLVLHVVHPYELVNPLLERLDRARELGIRLYSQFPLLRGINDHLAVVWELLAQLDDLNVRNLTIFVPDPISYSATFRLSLGRAFRLMDDLNAHGSAYINSTRLVVDTAYGKVRRSNIVSGPDSSGTVLFRRGGHDVRYFDLPMELDIPSEPQRLLWKGARFANHLLDWPAQGSTDEAALS